jgi:hypothetical protein
VSHGSFYHYFDTKEEIFREIAEEVEVRLISMDNIAHDAGPDDYLTVRTESAIARLQAGGLADPRIDTRYAAIARGGMVAKFAEMMFIGGAKFDLNTVVEQPTLLWANALGIKETGSQVASEARRGLSAAASLTRPQPPTYCDVNVNFVIGAQGAGIWHNRRSPT